MSLTLVTRAANPVGPALVEGIKTFEGFWGQYAGTVNAGILTEGYQEVK